MTNYMVKCGSQTGSGRICFTNPAKSGSAGFPKSKSGTALVKDDDNCLLRYYNSHYSAGLILSICIYSTLLCFVETASVLGLLFVYTLLVSVHVIKSYAVQQTTL